MKKGLFKAFGFMILIGIIYLVANIIVTFGFIVLVFIRNPEMISGNADIMFNELIQGISNYLLHIVIGANLLSLVFIALFFLARRDKFLYYCKFRKVKVSDALIITALGGFVNLLFITLLSLISGLEALSQTMDDYSELMEPLLDSPFLIMFIAIAIAAPLFEEIIMRGIILNDFRKVTPVWLAIVIQAIAFGLMHFNVVQSSYAAVLGIVLGVIYIKYNSIWMPILFHFSFNFTSLITDIILGEDVSLLLIGVLGLLGSIIFVALAKINYKEEYYEDIVETIIVKDDLEEVVNIGED